MIWQEPVRGAYPELGLLSLPGADQIRSYLKRGGPIPPLGRLTGLRPTDTNVGGTTFVMPASPWFRSPVGPIPGGALALPADGALGCAIQTTLPAATPYTTSELSMNFIRPAGVQSGTFISRGRLIHGGRSLALSEATVEDADGRLLAFASSRCFVFPAMQDLPPPPPMEPVPVEPTDSPDPYLRPCDVDVLSHDVSSSMSGLELMRGLIEGTLPPPPLYHLTGLRPIAAGDGTCSFALPASEWLASPIRTIQGGVLTLLADVTLASAVQTTIPPMTAYATIDLKLNFLRPAYPDGTDLVGHASVVHRGRNVAVASGEVVNADGKRLCLMTGSTHILPNRSWSYDRLEAATEEPVGRPE